MFDPTQPGDLRKRVAPKNRAVWIAYALTVALACGHASQSIIFHNSIPGDLADSRLVNCILEHLYQCFCGYGEFLSPGQFYPIKGTLVYSDNHFGTVLFYTAVRLFGASPEGAFQCWILVVLSLNAIALLFLLRQLNVHPLIACPIAFFGTSSSALVYKTGHPQVLPFFAFLFCLAFTCRFLLSGDVRQLGWAAVWFTYQNWCYMYHGYFAVFICGSLIALYLILFARAEFWTRFFQSLRQRWLMTSAVLAICLVGLVLVYFPYAQFATAAAQI
jgi:hypothetical protein